LTLRIPAHHASSGQQLDSSDPCTPRIIRTAIFQATHSARRSDQSTRHQSPNILTLRIPAHLASSEQQLDPSDPCTPRIIRTASSKRHTQVVAVTHSTRHQSPNILTLRFPAHLASSGQQLDPSVPCTPRIIRTASSKRHSQVVAVTHSIRHHHVFILPDFLFPRLHIILELLLQRKHFQRPLHCRPFRPSEL